ncbi:hypothetical protein [Bacillus cereus]
MEREICFNNICEGKPLVGKLYNVRKEYYRLSSPYFNLEQLPNFLNIILSIVFIFIVFIPFALVFSIIPEYFAIIRFIFVWISFGGSIYLGARWYTEVIYRLNRIQINKRVEKNNHTLTNLILAEKQLVEQLDILKIPVDYRYPYAISRFESYLSNYRADNYKDCVNIFEQERHNERKIDELRTIQELQRVTNHKIDKGNTIGLINLIKNR